MGFFEALKRAAQEREAKRVGETSVAPLPERQLTRADMNPGDRFRWSPEGPHWTCACPTKMGTLLDLNPEGRFRLLSNGRLPENPVFDVIRSTATRGGEVTLPPGVYTVPPGVNPPYRTYLKPMGRGMKKASQVPAPAPPAPPALIELLSDESLHYALLGGYLKNKKPDPERPYLVPEVASVEWSARVSVRLHTRASRREADDRAHWEPEADNFLKDATEDEIAEAARARSRS